MAAAATSLILPLSSSSSSPFSHTTKHTKLITLLPLLSKPSKFFPNNHRFTVRAVRDKTKPTQTPPPSSAEDVTKKYGLEAGLWKIFSTKEDEEVEKGEEKKSKGNQAKELLAKYGGAYLATSITLSLISFTLCYVLINAGVDVSSLLQKVGIAPNETGEKVGTFALAYAAHKAASPIRFPPTVALTPIVAGWIGKKTDKET